LPVRASASVSPAIAVILSGKAGPPLRAFHDGANRREVEARRGIINTNDPRTAANGCERSPDHQYTRSIDQTAELYAKVGHPARSAPFRNTALLSSIATRSKLRPAKNISLGLCDVRFWPHLPFCCSESKKGAKSESQYS
jgi:hypothetical protein